MLIGTIRPVETRTIEVEAHSLAEAHELLEAHCPAGFEFANTPVTMGKSTTLFTAVRTFVGRDGVTGFPHAIHGGMRGMPVAVTGIIATHPGYSFDMSTLPRFLINSRTKKGISGAPVFFYPDGKMLLTHLEDAGAFRHWSKGGSAPTSSGRSTTTELAGVDSFTVARGR